MAIAEELGTLEAVEKRVTFLAADNIVTLTRVALGIVFFWFGVLKFFPGASSAESIAGETITRLTFEVDSPGRFDADSGDVGVCDRGGIAVGEVSACDDAADGGADAGHVFCLSCFFRS